MKSFRDIIQAFGGGAALAHVIGQKPVTVRAWGLRNRIPSEHWHCIAKAAATHKIRGVSVDRMARFAERERA